MTNEELDKIKVKTEIAKNVAGLAALLMAAIWALFLFFEVDIKKSITDLKAAELNILKEQYNIEKLKSEKHKTLSLELIHEKTFQLANGKFGLLFRLKQSNPGLYPIIIDLTGKESFTLSKLGDEFTTSKVDVDKEYQAKPFNRITKSVLRSISGLTLAPGLSQSQLFYVQIDQPGIYFASVLLPVPDNLLTEQEIKQANEDGQPVVWGAQSYVEVKVET